eukprot:scaffold200109_cov19-Tisochrysis_lutea.AAC.2
MEHCPAPDKAQSQCLFMWLFQVLPMAPCLKWSMPRSIGPRLDALYLGPRPPSLYEALQGGAPGHWQSSGKADDDDKGDCGGEDEDGGGGLDATAAGRVVLATAAPPHIVSLVSFLLAPGCDLALEGLSRRRAMRLLPLIHLNDLKILSQRSRCIQTSKKLRPVSSHPSPNQGWSPVAHGRTCHNGVPTCTLSADSYLH